MADKFQAKLAFLGCLSAFPFFPSSAIFMSFKTNEALDFLCFFMHVSEHYFYLQQVKFLRKSAFSLAMKSATR
jgi:hypothetical protein